MLREVDARLLLPVVPVTAHVRESAEGLAPGLAEAGVELVDARAAHDGVDLVAAGSTEVAPATATPARCYLFVGRPVARQLRRRGLEAEDYLAVPDMAHAAYFVPLRWPAVLRYVYAHLRVAPTRARWWRSRVLAELLAAALRRGAAVPGVETVTVAAADSVVPAAVRAAERITGRAEAGWLLALGPVRDEGRVAFLVFAGETPRAALKCDRVVHDHVDLDRRVRAQHLADVLDEWPVVAARAPRPLGSVRTAGGLVEVETAAAGTVLTDLLRGPFDPARKRAAVEDVAAWVLAVAEATQHRPDAHPRPDSGPASGAPPDALEGVPRVVCHGDLWSGNVVVDGDGRFRVIDWADIDPSGLPLGDLVLFVTESLAELDGADTPDARAAHFVALTTGRLASSQVLCRWVRAMVDALRLDPALVGSVVGAALDSMADRRLRLEGIDPQDPGRAGAGALADPVVRRAQLWAETPGLGAEWSAWREGADGDRDGSAGGTAQGGRSRAARAVRAVARRADRLAGAAAAGLARAAGRDRTDELARARLLVVAPHPDDETLAAGALLAMHAGRGDARVVVASDGGRGVFGADPRDTARRRRGELSAALGALGLTAEEAEWWGLEDGTLGAHVEDLALRLGRVLEAHRPEVVLAPWAHDAHPDHAAVGRAARVACAGRSVELLEYVTWGWAEPSRVVRGRRGPGAPQRWVPAGRPVVVRPHGALEAKRAALACYGSQLGGPGTGVARADASLDEGFVDLFLSRAELFWPAPRPAHR